MPFFFNSACVKLTLAQILLSGGDRNANPMLIDFGLAVVMEPNGASPEGEQLWNPVAHSGPVGKIYYMVCVLSFCFAFPRGVKWCSEGGEEH